MQTFFSADYHLGHANIMKYANRPFKNVDDMNNVIIRNHNQRVKEDDTFIHDGDFCFHSKSNRGEGEGMKAEEYIKQLNGHKILIQGNHDCFSEETRLLTKSGYKYYYEIKEGDLIPTVNLEKNCVEYQPVNKIIINSVEKAYCFKSRTAEGCFSSNHNHLYSFGAEGNLPIKKGISEKIWKYKSPIKFLSSFISGNKDLKIEDKWIKLLAWILTDGNISKKYKYITIYQSKKKNINYLYELLNSLKIDYKVSKRNRNTKEICGKKLVKKPLTSYEFKINAKYSKIILKKLNLKSKYILPFWVLNLSDRQYLFFIKELVRGDGSVANSNTFVLWGKKEILEQIMGGCVTHNLKSNLIKDKRNSYYLTVSQRIHNREKNFSYKTIGPKNKYISSYNKTMWCVNVKNHIIFIELNGKTLITGNSNNTVKTKIQHLVLAGPGFQIKVVHKPIHANPSYPLNLIGHVHNAWKMMSFKDYYNIKKQELQKTDLPIHYLNSVKQFIERWKHHKRDSLLLNIGVDVHNYMPISFEEVICMYNKWRKENA